jgi:hypothetical protein
MISLFSVYRIDRARKKTGGNVHPFSSMSTGVKGVNAQFDSEWNHERTRTEKIFGTDFTDYTAKFYMKAGHPAFM